MSAFATQGGHNKRCVDVADREERGIWNWRQILDTSDSVAVHRVFARVDRVLRITVGEASQPAGQHNVCRLRPRCSSLRSRLPVVVVLCQRTFQSEAFFQLARVVLHHLDHAENILPHDARMSAGGIC